MVEISRDGKRVYFTNSLYGAIDPQFYPEGIEGWMVKLDAKPDGGIAFDHNFFVQVAGAASAAPGAARRRRLLVGLLLLSVARAAPAGCVSASAARRAMTDAWPWLALAGLGAFHGLNPAMGWLFAVALGLHRHSRAIVCSRSCRSRWATPSRSPPSPPVLLAAAGPVRRDARAHRSPGCC